MCKQAMWQKYFNFETTRNILHFSPITMKNEESFLKIWECPTTTITHNVPPTKNKRGVNIILKEKDSITRSTCNKFHKNHSFQ